MGTSGRWTGAAAVCINDKNELLMVLQGKPEEEKVWSVPSGGMEVGETYEQCCEREVWEETGYRVKVRKKIFEKTGRTYSMDVSVHYFEVEWLGGQAALQDPDGLIYDIQWKSQDEVKRLKLSFPEDREFLLRLLEANN